MNRAPLPSIPRWALAASAIVLVAGACGGDDKGTAPTDATTATTSVSPATSAGADMTVAASAPTVADATTDVTSAPSTSAGDDEGDGGAAVGPDGLPVPCSLATPADVQAAFGGTAADGVTNEDDGGCDFDMSGASNAGQVTELGLTVSLTVDDSSPDAFTPSDEATTLLEATKVDGVGDDAWKLPGQLHVKVGDVSFVVAAFGFGDLDQDQLDTDSVALATTIAGRL